MEKIIYHKRCTVSVEKFACTYNRGEISAVKAELKIGEDDAMITVIYRNGDVFNWKTNLIDCYTFQFGIAISCDGKYLFAQTWERGLFCLDPKNGSIIWKTKSKCGITSIFVNDDTILCHQHGKALQLINIHTGEVISEKRPATAWEFTAINNKFIICQSTARLWEIIDTETLEVKQAFSNKIFTDNHGDYVVNSIQLTADNTLVIKGFKNVFDEQDPKKMLPDLTFTNILKTDI